MMRDPLNKLIMEEVGLTVNNSNKVIDQDTRQELAYNGKYIKFSSKFEIPISDSDIKFDPISNRNMMATLFAHFATKIQEEDEIYIQSYSEVPSKDGTSALTAYVNGYVVNTDFYYNPSLKYLDMIQRLNGNMMPQLKQHDVIPEKLIEKLKALK